MKDTALQTKKFLTLHQRILKSLLIVLGIYTFFGILMVLLISFAGDFTSKLISENYTSVIAATDMLWGWDRLRHDTTHSSSAVLRSVVLFEKGLVEEDVSISEPGEANIAFAIHELWIKVKPTLPQISEDDNVQMRQLLDSLIQLNEAGMHRYERRGRDVGRIVLWSALLFLIISGIVIFGISKILAHRIANPLKKLALFFEGNLIFGKKLELPVPNTQEHLVLNNAFENLWQRVSSLNFINERELFLQKSKIAGILSQVGDAILVLGLNGEILHCNRRLAQLIELPEEKLGFEIWDQINPCNSNHKILKQALLGRSVNTQKLELVISNQKKVFELRVHKIDAENNSAFAWLFSLNDITERTHREKLKSDLIGVLSHELKTPLQSISTASEILLNKKHQLDADGRFLIETLAKEVQRIRSVANDFIQVTLEDLHTLRLKFEIVPIEELLSEWLKPFRLLAQEKNIQIEFIAEGINSCVKLDRIKFPWVISNLLSNSLRLAPVQSKIRVSLKELNEQVLLQIKDDGPGVSKEMEEKIFEPYFQLPYAESRVQGGFLGLGLAIARELVNAHGGSIKYVSTQEQGALFQIELPRVDINGGQYAY